jgi:hypothetical protein
MNFAEVRERFADLPESAKSIAGEEWLELYDLAFRPLSGVSAKTVAAIAASLCARMGINTGKT